MLLQQEMGEGWRTVVEAKPELTVKPPIPAPPPHTHTPPLPGPRGPCQQEGDPSSLCLMSLHPSLLLSTPLSAQVGFLAREGVPGAGHIH